MSNNKRGGSVSQKVATAATVAGIAALGITALYNYSALQERLALQRKRRADGASVNEEFSKASSSSSLPPPSPSPPPPSPRVLKFLVEVGDDAHIETGVDAEADMGAAVPSRSSVATTLPPHLLVRVFEHCELDTTVASVCVCRNWSRALRRLVRHRAYLRRCAIVGFRDSTRVAAGFVRGHCWRLATRADAVQRRPGTRSYYQQLLADVDNASDAARCIRLDTPRTLIHLKAYASADVAEQLLSQVLNAYAVHDRDVGYCQGMNFVVGQLLTRMTAQSAFWTLVVLMNGRHYNFRRLYLTGSVTLFVLMRTFDVLLQHYLPRLAAHFSSGDMYVESVVYLPQWMLTLYTHKSFPMDTSVRIWDLLLVDGRHGVLLAVALALLARSESTLLCRDNCDVMEYLATLPDDRVHNADALVRTAAAFCAGADAAVAVVDTTEDAVVDDARADFAAAAAVLHAHHAPFPAGYFAVDALPPLGSEAVAVAASMTPAASSSSSSAVSASLLPVARPVANRCHDDSQHGPLDHQR